MIRRLDCTKKKHQTVFADWEALYCLSLRIERKSAFQTGIGEDLPVVDPGAYIQSGSQYELHPGTSYQRIEFATSPGEYRSAVVLDLWLEKILTNTASVSFTPKM